MLQPNSELTIIVKSYVKADFFIYLFFPSSPYPRPNGEQNVNVWMFVFVNSLLFYPNIE